MNHPQENELLRAARNKPLSNLEKVIVGVVIGVLGTLAAIGMFGNPY